MPATFSINHRATFKLPVKFPFPGGETATITFDCRHLKMSEIQDIEKRATDRLLGYAGDNYQLELADAHAIVLEEFATSWDAAEEFTHGNLASCLDLHPTLYGAFASAFRSALVGEREKP